MNREEYCDFVDNKNGDLCEEAGTVCVTDLGIVSYDKACPAHARYLKRWLKKHEEK